jgi:hypothetical protein
MLVSSLAFHVFKLEGNVLALRLQLHHLLCFCLIYKTQTSDLGGKGGGGYRTIELRQNANFS